MLLHEAALITLSDDRWILLSEELFQPKLMEMFANKPG